jgi:hypothetical protein
MTMLKSWLWQPDGLGGLSLVRADAAACCPDSDEQLGA